MVPSDPAGIPPGADADVDGVAPVEEDRGRGRQGGSHGATDEGVLPAFGGGGAPQQQVGGTRAEQGESKREQVRRSWTLISTMIWKMERKISELYGLFF